METTKIVGYARVSTREQAVDSKALEQQSARLRAAGATEIFTDIQSGKKDNRPALKELLSLVKEGKIKEVISTRIDRVARSLVKLRECIDIFVEAGTNLRFLDQQMDLNTSQGKLLANILGALAEWEVDLLSERVRHGKRYRRSQELVCDCYPWPYEIVDGKYHLIDQPFLCLLETRPDNYLELYQENSWEKLPGLTKKQVARDCIEIFLREKGLTRAVKAIFGKYGIVKRNVKRNGSDGILHWTPSGLRSWLTNPVLCGHTVYSKRVATSKGKRKRNHPDNWQVVKNTHLEHRLMTDEEALEIHQIIKFNTRIGHPSFNNDPNRLEVYREYTYQSGLVFCAECGSKCLSKHANRPPGYFYFACRYSGMGCGNRKSISKQKIESALIKALVQKSSVIDQEADPSVLVSPSKSETLKKLEYQLSALEMIPNFDPDLEKLKEKTRQQIAEEINPFASGSLLDKTAEELIRAGNNLAIWNTLSNDDKVKIYPKLVGRITIRHGEVESIVLNIKS
jgi:predicted site-specific integrase-resolvase